MYGDRAKTGAAVGERQVVINGLGHADAGNRITHLVGQLGHLVGGILGIAATVIEEVADVMGPEDFDQSLVFTGVLGNILEFVTAGPESTARGVDQCFNGLVRFQAGVDQFFFQRTDDAITAGIHLADLVRILAGGLDNATGTGVNNGGNPARLGVKCVFDSHLGLKPPAGSTMAQMIRHTGRFFMRTTRLLTLRQVW